MNQPLTKNEPRDHRILIVDDTEAIHEDFRKTLARRPGAAGDDFAAAESALFGASAAEEILPVYSLDSAYQGAEGIRLVREARATGNPFAVAFMDVRMPPGMDGIEATAELLQVDPELQIVVCTAYSDYSWSAMTKACGNSDRIVILKKPFDTIEVLQLAKALTEKWTLLQQLRERMENLEKQVQLRTQHWREANERLENELAERKKIEEQLRHSQKLDAIGQLAGGIAHDFNNVLTVIQGCAQLLNGQEGNSPENKECLELILSGAQRAANLTRQLLTFSRKQVLQPRKFDLNEELAGFAKMLGRVLGEDISLQIQPSGEPALINADAGMLDQILMNLTINARDAMPTGGELRLATELMELDARAPKINPEAREGQFVCLVIADTGTGIAAEHLPRIFEPFFTTKGLGRGTGLGLSTVHGIVKQHQGWIEVASQVDKGTTFRIYFPRCFTAAGERSGGSDFQKPPGGTETILIVEDEDPVREVASGILRRLGYDVVEASSGPDALDIWKQDGERIDLVLSDVVMPGGMTGYDLVTRLREQRPGLKYILTSGYNPESARKVAPLEGVRVLQKPYQIHTLAQRIRQGLDGVSPSLDLLEA